MTWEIEPNTLNFSGAFDRAGSEGDAQEQEALSADLWGGLPELTSTRPPSISPALLTALQLSDTANEFVCAPADRPLAPQLPGSNNPEITENPDGSRTSRYNDGSSITREPNREGRAGRILSAISVAGERIAMRYNGNNNQPDAVTIDGTTWTFPECNAIYLNQETGEVEFTGIDGKGNPWAQRHRLSGESILQDSRGRTTVQSTRDRTSRVTHDLNGHEVERTELNRTTGVSNTFHTQHGLDQNGRLVQHLAHSWTDPAGRLVPIPGLTHDQVNQLRQANGMPLLRPNEAPVWHERVRQQTESFGSTPDDRRLTYTTTSGQTFSVSMEAAGPWINTRAHSPLDPRIE